MRRRWTVDQDAVETLSACWFIGGFCLFLGLTLLWPPASAGAVVGASVWLGPFVLFGAPVGAVRAVRWLRENPPVKRVEVPVTRDLRERDD